MPSDWRADRALRSYVFGVRLRERAPRVGYTSLVMIVPEAIEQLDSLRERLHGASERLGWLRSYL